MKTVLKVAAGVLLGGGVLIAGVVGVLALTGGDPPTKTERRIAEQEAQQAEDPIESYDSLEQGEEVLGDAADEWCESEEGDELAQLGSEVDRGPTGTSDAAFARHARRVNETSDRMLGIAKSAPPGAYCAGEELDSMVDYWNQLAGDPDFPNARSEAKRIRRFQRQSDLADAGY